MGSWATVHADPASIFDKDPIGLWSDMLKALSAPRVIHSRLAHDTWTSQILP